MPLVKLKFPIISIEAPDLTMVDLAGEGHATGTKNLRGRSIVQNHAQQAAVDRQAVGVIDKAKLLELHHEMADPRSRCADHLRQMFLINSW